MALRVVDPNRGQEKPPFVHRGTTLTPTPSAPTAGSLQLQYRRQSHLGVERDSGVNPSFETPVRRHAQSFHDGARPNASIGRVRTLSDVAGGGPNQLPVAEFKVVLVGSSNAGKTCLAFRYVCGGFRSASAPTVGAAFNCVQETIEVPPLSSAGQRRESTKAGDSDPTSVTVKIGLWDTAGQEQFAELVPLYFRDAHAVLLVVDSSRPDGLADLQRWVTRVSHSAPPDVLRYLVLTKTDLPEDERWVTFDDAMEFAAIHEPGGIEGYGTILSPGRASTVVTEICNSSLVNGRCPSLAASVATSRRAPSVAAAVRASAAVPMKIFEVSSATGAGVSQLFGTIASDAYQRHLRSVAAQAAMRGSTGGVRPLRPGASQPRSGEKNRCC
jgi:Ras-related protein Rab-2A